MLQVIKESSETVCHRGPTHHRRPAPHLGRSAEDAVQLSRFLRWAPLIAALLGAGVQAGPTVETTQAAFAGVSETAAGGVSVMRFSGIRFAEPPTGDRRWRAPRPSVAKGAVDATEWPAACMQDERTVDWYAGVAASFGQGREVVVERPPVSEDCLFLNVWTPNAARSLPVMVWIHGGGNINGWSYEPNYLGRELAAQGVVAVSIQYRLGVFGFLAHPSLSQEQTPQSSGHYGILDQIEALRWIRREIGAFGGDPDSITLFGESAGAGDINYLLLSPLAKGLFQRAISQSGGWPADQRRTLAEAETDGERFLSAADISGIEGLREVPADDLLALAADHYQRGYDDPSVDGWLLPAPSAELLRTKAFAPVPVMFGTNGDEDRTLIRADQATAVDWRRALTRVRDGEGVERRLAGHPLAERMAALYAAAQFHCPSIHFADAFAAAGAPTYVYRFERVREGDHGLGAYHGAEIPYVFATHDPWLRTNADDQTLTRRMMAYWLNFARHGDPNGGGALPWPRWQPGGEAMILDRALSAGPLDLALCPLL